MGTREMSTIVGVTLTMIMVCSPARDLIDEPLSLHASQAGLIRV